ncbi:MAG: hypothetical protein IJS50_00020 [Desulfovibrio sp.]|nr:hypothetical protein [Desulfovibrio sp.]
MLKCLSHNYPLSIVDIRKNLSQYFFQLAQDNFFTHLIVTPRQKDLKLKKLKNLPGLKLFSQIFTKKTSVQKLSHDLQTFKLAGIVKVKPRVKDILQGKPERLASR